MLDTSTGLPVTADPSSALIAAVFATESSRPNSCCVPFSIVSENRS